MTQDLTIAKFNETLSLVNNTNTIPDARRLLALAQGFVETARKLYNANTINSILEAGEDKNNSQDIAKKAGELKLYAEARLGELIKAEQEAGRLATSGSYHGNQFQEGNRNNTTTQTLADYGLTKDDSYHAQQLAEHKEIIAQVIVASLDIPTRAAVEKEIKKREQEFKLPVIPLPTNTFNVLYADPPWEYNNSGISGAAANHYPTLSTDKICELGVSLKTPQDAVLFLWATNPMREDALLVVKAWGFNYKTNLVWIKDRAGQGFYVKGQHELLLLGTKGSCRPDETVYIRSIINEPKREHSRKPEGIYELIEIMYPVGKYLELFARQKRDKWESWGNEIKT